ncbi:TrkA family potassium uptake protein [Nanchangia anserum]|uniref:Trk system potassium uptake protein TrkA n=1 Tax=Nanchangia anserum TaxID=2692125 RepID=A0A8I0GB84_9ACTO|nr:TrkA family potassium uptake protein [Nanchangia anserum]MBD3688826.1 TrkA family potassium uptake protein [Nanchangia anserum]QOX81101.1 TrkA family potassium uptake protein [Nanchangia anserum]
MHFVVMGSGRVGSTVAAALDERGHSVAVIDINSAAFRKLPEDFSGQRIKGIGFDRAVLRKAGIEDAYGFAAVSSGDNTNIVAARVARETFGVRHVVARILDPRRAEVYERLGVRTIGAATWTSAQIIDQILPDQARTLHTDPDSGISIIKIRPHAGWVGVSFASLTERLEISIAYIVRAGHPVLDVHGGVVQSDDTVYVACERSRVADVRYALGRAPGQED